jgi:uncharacterized protein YbjQ (UPF0145 family)
MQELLSDASTGLKVLLWMGGVILLAYCIGQLLVRRTVLVSKRWTAAAVRGDQYYYLPTASLTLRVTAKVLVSKSVPDNKVIDATLLSLDVDPCVNLEPDPEQLFTLHYQPFPFSNDEVRITTNAQGLLENVMSTTEDRISQIVTELGDATKEAASEAMANMVMEASAPYGPAATATVCFETQEFKNTFMIPSAELRTGAFTRSWTIRPDGAAARLITADASFKGALPEVLAAQKGADAGPVSADPAQPTRGLLARPLRTTMLVLTRKGKPLLSVALLVPDETRLMTVPVLRFPFIKNIATPKFTNGILTENYIDKPSEVEGFLSIPINMLKAVCSIPSALFSFKVTHLQKDVRSKKPPIR